MIITRKWCMPNKNTFKIKPIKEFILENLIDEGIILDPFANECSLKELITNPNITYISNDLDTQYNTDYNLEAIDFLKSQEDNSIDMILFDPPYSVRQVSECYKKLGRTVTAKDTSSAYWSNLKKEISRIVKKDGKVITCGWNSGGIGKSNGFEIEKILLVPHGGPHNDTIVVLDKKI